MSEYQYPSTTPVASNETATIVDTVTTIEAQKNEILELQAKLAESNRQMELAKDRRSYWEQRYYKGQNDWNTLNEGLNEYAENNSMCSSYEDQLDEWNASFSEFTLTGREKEYEVSVTLTATYYTTVTVTAASAEAAQEDVEQNYDDSQIMQNESWSSPDDSNWEVTDVTC